MSEAPTRETFPANRRRTAAPPYPAAAIGSRVPDESSLAAPSSRPRGSVFPGEQSTSFAPLPVFTLPPNSSDRDTTRRCDDTRVERSGRVSPLDYPLDNHERGGSRSYDYYGPDAIPRRNDETPALPSGIGQNSPDSTWFSRGRASVISTEPTRQPARTPHRSEVDR